MTGGPGPHLTRSRDGEHALDHSGRGPGPSTAGPARVRREAADGTGPAARSPVMVPGKK
jgi:hypothetical protein